jgi:hypothetical protein
VQQAGAGLRAAGRKGRGPGWRWGGRRPAAGGRAGPPPPRHGEGRAAGSCAHLPQGDRRQLLVLGRGVGGYVGRAADRGAAGAARAAGPAAEARQHLASGAPSARRARAAAVPAVLPARGSPRHILEQRRRSGLQHRGHPPARVRECDACACGRCSRRETRGDVGLTARNECSRVAARPIVCRENGESGENRQRRAAPPAI